MSLTLLGAVLAVSCFLGLGRSLWTPDEPREAEIAREMYLSPGIIPTLNGEPFYEKPPLYYWVVAAAFALVGGPSPAAARAISGMAGFLTLVALFFWAKRAHSSTAGVAAVLILATSSLFFISTHWVRLDPMLGLFTTMVFWCAWEATRGGGAPALVVMYLALALGLLTKGLIGPVIAGAGLAFWCALERRQRPWRPLRPVLGVALLLLATVALGTAIYASGGREALWQWGWVNHVQRFLDPGSKGHRQPFYRYAMVYLPLAVFPWLVPALGVLRPAFWKAGIGDRPLKRFCACMVGAGLLVLSLSSSKREVYLLPLMAPACLLMALAVVDWLESGVNLSGMRRRPGPMAWTNAVLLGLLGAAPAVALTIRTRAVQPATVVSLLLALPAFGGAILFLKRADRRCAFACGVLSVGICCGSLLVLAVPVLEVENDFAPIISWIDTQIEPGRPIYAVGADETLRGIIPFTTGRSLVMIRPGRLGAPGDPEARRPEYLVYQLVRRSRIAPQVEEAYDLLRRDVIGPGRSISLWRLKKPWTATPGR